MDAREAKALDDIERHGCHVVLVREDGDLPPFAYSVGIQRTTGAPEIVVLGLAQELAHWLVNEAHRRQAAGERFAEGAEQQDFLGGGFAVRFHRVAREHYREHFGWNRWLYGGDDFEVLQLVYPSTQGVWPCDPAAPAAFRARQPLLFACGCPPAHHELESLARADHRRAYVCEHVFTGASAVLYVVRDEEGDWQLLCGESNHDRPRLVGLGHLIERDETLRQVLDLAPGETAERVSAGAAWRRAPLA
jgi:hypothetical protein